ncbi:DUF7674 family protein [Faecalispora anaeroviscerum]|uniref:DUF7674 family protein n=1 Tax=Faecalispora anaeroviscerum TaxID=2991836 RepID=UPI0024BA01E9|nr:hypothetical protein [Faecalispora anaeroviscerum]
MEQKAFDLIAEKVRSVLLEQGFQRKEDVQEEQGQAAVYLSEDAAYSVLYERATKLFHLRACGVTDAKPDNQWKKLSSWAFDPEADTAAYAASIAEDFAETLGGSSRKELIRQQKKRKKKDEDATTDPLFFFNRLASIFPELRAELAQERATYGTVRSVTFTREHVVSRVEQLAKTYSGTEPFKKLCNVLNEIYEHGDMDVRSIITIVLLNGINDQQALENLSKNFSEDLSKVYDKAKALKGKKIRPEKKKKKPKYADEMLQTLDDHV